MDALQAAAVDGAEKAGEAAVSAQLRELKKLKKPAVVAELARRGLDTAGRATDLAARLAQAARAEHEAAGTAEVAQETVVEQRPGGLAVLGAAERRRREFEVKHRRAKAGWVFESGFPSGRVSSAYLVPQVDGTPRDPRLCILVLGLNRSTYCGIS
jgi:hypothetical protein